MKYWYYIYLGNCIYDEVWSYTPVDFSDGDKVVSLNTLMGSTWQTPIDKVYISHQSFMKNSNSVTREELRNKLIDELI